MPQPRVFLSLAFAVGLSAVCSSAHATFSIVAADAATQTMGSAGASCVPYEVIRILRIASGKGLLVAQANFDDAALAQGQSMLAANENPAAVLATITDAAKFPMAPKMQYGIVDIAGNVASYTGPEALVFAGDKPGEMTGVSFAVQGNILTGPDVLERMATAAGEGCDLPERLMHAIEAAGIQGGGDSRCTGEGISAASAYIAVEQNAQSILYISLPDMRPNDPMIELRKQFNAWRMSHPCPMVEPADPENTHEGHPQVSPGCSMTWTTRPEGAGIGAFVVAVIVGMLRRSSNSWFSP